MLKDCIFHKPVIPCDTLKCLALCLTSNVITLLYLLWVLFFNPSRKILYFRKVFVLDGCLQACGLVNVLKVHIR